VGKAEVQENRTAARQRSNIYGLLAALYRQEMTSELLGQIKDPQIMGVLSDFGSEGMRDLMEKPEKAVLEELAMEYARLFLGPGKHISPHESIHHRRDDGQFGQLWGASTVEVKKFISATGLDYSPDYNGLPDHIAVEFEFMQQVALEEEQAWEEPVKDKALFCQSIQKRFVDEHLIRWIPTFCEKVIKETDLPFYRELAELTENFIELEKEELDGSEGKPTCITC
jgi:putative dimethyl sulfoxide reductase chaperone